MDEQVFSGTAHYYSAYRPSYPQVLMRDLVQVSAGDHGESMVDWGCGTGEVAIPLSAHFDRVLAVDIDAGMVALARDKAGRQHAGNIDWMVGRAEDLQLAERSQDLIVAGSSFHWMDRELLSARAYGALRPHGVIAILGGGSEVWNVRCGWHEVAVATLRQWLGEQRRAGSGTYTVNRTHQEFLAPAGFTLESRDYTVEHTWTADSIVGYLYSTSYAKPELFGDRKEEFEADLRARLARLSPTDAFPETLEFYAIFGSKRPR